VTFRKSIIIEGVEMSFNREKELNIILKIIDKEEDTLKAWWITLTGLSSAIIVGTFISYFSGRITENNQESVLLVLLLFLPILIIFLFELFLRRIELNTKTKQIVSCYLDPKINQSLLSIENVLSLIDLKFHKLEFLEKQITPIQKWLVKFRIGAGITLSLYINLFVLVNWVDVLFPTSSTGNSVFGNLQSIPFILFFSFLTLALTIFWMFFAHRIVKRVIIYWGEDKKDNMANETS